MYRSNANAILVRVISVIVVMSAVMVALMFEQAARQPLTTELFQAAQSRLPCGAEAVRPSEMEVAASYVIVNRRPLQHSHLVEPAAHIVVSARPHDALSTQ